MDISKLTSAYGNRLGERAPSLPAFEPTFNDPMAPRREIELSQADERAVQNALGSLGAASSKIEKLFGLFEEWQSRRTYTMRRILITSILVVLVSAWVGINYKEISFLGLRVANGNSEHFLIFLIAAVLVSTLVYGASLAIDLSVRKAKIGFVSREMRSLRATVCAVDDILERNEIKSFSDLYFDFVNALRNPDHDALDAYRAIKFYEQHLSATAWWRKWLVVAEQVLISIGALGALAVLAVSLYRLGN